MSRYNKLQNHEVPLPFRPACLEVDIRTFFLGKQAWMSRRVLLLVIRFHILFLLFTVHLKCGGEGGGERRFEGFGGRGQMVVVSPLVFLLKHSIILSNKTA